LTGALPSADCNIEESSISHFVSVALDKETFTLTSSKRFDSELTLKASTADANASEILNIIYDVCLDILVFNSIPILKQLFADIEARHHFSRSKVLFAVHKELFAYGFAVSDNFNYISLASCCRPHVNAAINLYEYGILWQSFINDFLFEGIRSRRKGLAPELEAQEIFLRVLSLKGLGGQFDRETLEKEIQKLSGCGLSFLCITVKRPHYQKDRENLAHLFRAGKWRRNLIRTFPISQFRYFLKFLPYLKMYFFRVK